MTGYKNLAKTLERLHFENSTNIENFRIEASKILDNLAEYNLCAVNDYADNALLWLITTKHFDLALILLKQMNSSHSAMLISNGSLGSNCLALAVVAQKSSLTNQLIKAIIDSPAFTKGVLLQKLHVLLFDLDLLTAIMQLRHEYAFECITQSPLCDENLLMQRTLPISILNMAVCMAASPQMVNSILNSPHYTPKVFASLSPLAPPDDNTGIVSYALKILEQGDSFAKAFHQEGRDVKGALNALITHPKFDKSTLTSEEKLQLTTLYGAETMQSIDVSVAKTSATVVAPDTFYGSRGNASPRKAQNDETAEASNQSTPCYSK